MKRAQPCWPTNQIGKPLREAFYLNLSEAELVIKAVRSAMWLCDPRTKLYGSGPIGAGARRRDQEEYDSLKRLLRQLKSGKDYSDFDQEAQS